MTFFQQVLDEAIKLATGNDDVATELFRAGDVNHLQRWRDDGRADEIWKALHPGRLDDHVICVAFIRTMLGVRHLAEDADQLNKTISRLKKPRERRHVVNRLTRGEISHQEFGEFAAFLKKPTDFFQPIFSVRSDEDGTRQCTIFCRVLSDFVRHGTRWRDKEVAVLAEIALNRKDITTDMVRSYREAGRRDATRKGRRQK